MSTIAAGAAPPAAAPGAMRKVIFGSLIGTTIEWYDFFLYGTAAALVFNKLFFPKADPLTGAMLAFTTYALGFVARPLGGIVFGHFGDRIGRKKLLMASLVMMGGSTFAIGLLPTFAQVGVLAPLLLTLLRLLQGFAVGGEWGGAVLMAAEYGDAKRRGTWAGWPQVGVPAGNLVAAAILALMAAFQSDADFMAWGWRVPFLLSAVLVAVGWWVRVSLEETPVFQALAEREHEIPKAPLVEAVRKRPGGLAIGAGLRLGENICYYVLTAFSITYLTEVAHLSRAIALNALLIGAAVEVVTMPLFSWLSDRVGRRPVYAIGAAGMALWAFAFFRLLDTGSAPLIVAAVAVGLVCHGAMYGPQAAFIAELFPTRFRYSGASFAYQATSIVAGSLAPIIALAMFKQTHSALPIAIYVALACSVSVIAALMARETRGKSFAEIDAETA
ncbi:MFS transporter [Phenylobacterium soli]|uniref:MFS transporter n=1 Tax=Phenylobacterium soli TaxID=2170551 RepID=A0A328ALV9_9CAUL|nr:MFS transporter [Phenylobacterium soli]RAK53848.1 MFS transporter [Phenylobacterium soli]